MHHLRRWLSNPRMSLLFAILFIASQAAIVTTLQAGNAEALLIKLQLTFDASTFNQLLGNATAAQIQALQQHYLFDYVHPVWYGMMTLCLLSWLMTLNQLPARWNWLFIPAIVFPALDVVENTLHSPWIYLHSTASDPWVLIAGLAASIKWSLALVYLVLAIGLAVRYRLHKPQLSAA
ncbi:hypothetical protein ACQUQU_10685 [Thalassolituus sp. LLYu03]|uniref:hypothetical protein n=1 Tax=Thalassolituus sp. LLYu03 TaxID=3421656 RepID=UPI003D2B761B